MIEKGVSDELRTLGAQTTRIGRGHSCVVVVGRPARARLFFFCEGTTSYRCAAKEGDETEELTCGAES